MSIILFCWYAISQMKRYTFSVFLAWPEKHDGFIASIYILRIQEWKSLIVDIAVMDWAVAIERVVTSL